MSRLIAIWAMLVLTVAMDVLVMMRGWGLQPRSWWWIVGVGVFVNTVVRVVSDKIIKEK